MKTLDVEAEQAGKDIISTPNTTPRRIRRVVGMAAILVATSALGSANSSHIEGLFSGASDKGTNIEKPLNYIPHAPQETNPTCDTRVATSCVTTYTKPEMPSPEVYEPLPVPSTIKPPEYTIPESIQCPYDVELPVDSPDCVATVTEY